MAGAGVLYTGPVVPAPSFGPFRPGPGRTPPYLAGREPEQSLFRGLLDGLERRAPPPTEVVLYGPRGNGKTALLAWLQRETASRRGVEVVRLTPSSFRTSAELAGLLRRTPWWRRLAPEELSVRGVRWKSKGPRAEQILRVLRARVRKKAFVLLLDEAHTLDREPGRDLLDAAQQVADQLPFLLVLAGTPDLLDHLDTLGAGFRSRAEQWPVGRLSPAAAAEGLRRPLAAEGFLIDDDALAEMVETSHGYPYFIQLWGKAVWGRTGALPAGARRAVTAEVVEAARADFDRQKNTYYKHRFSELENLEMLSVGRSVAAEFRGRPRLTPDDLRAAVRAGLPNTSEPGAILTATKALAHLGFIWRDGGNQDWEPGIPSLMDYFAGPADARVPQALPRRRPEPSLVRVRIPEPPPAPGDRPSASSP